MSPSIGHNIYRNIESKISLYFKSLVVSNIRYHKVGYVWIKLALLQKWMVFIEILYFQKTKKQKNKKKPTKNKINKQLKEFLNNKVFIIIIPKQLEYTQNSNTQVNT